MKRAVRCIPTIAAALMLWVFGSLPVSAQSLTITIPEPGKGVDPKADKVVKQMADYLTGLKAFTVDTDATFDVVLKNGQKVQYCNAGSVYVRRPNKLKADRKGQFADLTMYYDGKAITVYGKKKNLYASAEAPPVLDKAIDFARDQLGLIAPAADLLYTSVYDDLMKDVESGVYLGENDTDGVMCDHVAFRTKHLDWQLWIEKGSKPLPHRFVITSTKLQGTPQFGVNLRNWKTDADLPDSTFEFVPPKDAKKIEFLRPNGTKPITTEGGKPK